MPFGQPPSLAQRIAEQAMIDKIDATAAHTAAIHATLGTLKDALDYADPDIKYDSAMLDPNVEYIVRYEPKRFHFDVCITDAGAKVTAQWAGKQWTITYAAPGWQRLDYPPGTLLFSGDAATRHFVIVRMSNLKSTL